MDQVDAAFNRSDLGTAKSLLEVVRTMMPRDNYVAQQLAYKSKLPRTETALNEAAEILETLSPTRSTDTETLGLYVILHLVPSPAPGGSTAAGGQANAIGAELSYNQSTFL
jgi:hypothetical protein